MPKPQLIRSSLLLLCIAGCSSGSEFWHAERIYGICMAINLHGLFRRMPAELLLSMLPPSDGESWE